MANWALRFWRDEKGQDLIEYSLILTLFALMTMALVIGVKPSAAGMWNRMQEHLSVGSTVAAGG